MLLAPQSDQRGREPAPVTLQFMDNRMASRTKGDQPGGGVAAGAAMVDGALIPSPTPLAAVAVAGEDSVTMSAEAPARMRDLPIAAAAQASDGGIGPASTEQGGLSGFQQSSV